MFSQVLKEWKRKKEMKKKLIQVENFQVNVKQKKREENRVVE